MNQYHKDLTGNDLHINKPFSEVTKTGNYVIQTTDELIRADTSGGAFALTLPTAVGVTGKQYVIKKISSDSLALTINTTSSQTIDGSLTQVVLSQYTSLTLVSNGTNWDII